MPEGQGGCYDPIRYSSAQEAIDATRDTEATLDVYGSNDAQYPDSGIGATGGLTTLDDYYTGGYGMYNTQGDSVSTSGYQWGANAIPAGDGMTPDSNTMYYYYGTPDYSPDATVQNSVPAAGIGETDWNAVDWSSGWNSGAQEPVINTQWDSSSPDGNWI